MTIDVKFHDRDALVRLMATWPYATSILDVEGDQCRYPLWDLVPHESGGYYTQPLGETHRYVCGAPTHSPKLPYCRACTDRLAMQRASDVFLKNVTRGL